MRIAVTVLVVAVATSAAALRWAPASEAVGRKPQNPKPAFPGGRETASNIAPDSYVGPEACSRCHEENYESWLEHPHRRMNQLATEGAVLGDFAGREVAFGGGRVRFDRDPERAFTVTLERPGDPRRKYRVTRTIGVRLKQFYVGLLIEGSPVGRNGASDEVVLPFGWWIHQRRWMPISYFDAYGEDVDAHGKLSFDPWSPKDVPIAKVCAYCHNTVPYLYRFGSAENALGFPLRDLVMDRAELRTELSALVELGTDRSFPATFAARLPLDSALVTVGISCESCHFGARAHAENDDDYRFGPSHPHFAWKPSNPHESAERSKDNPALVKAICRQCHSSDGDTYPDGSSLINSREALELDQGECASQIACTSCHDPHVAGPAREGGPDDPAHVSACTSCHDSYASGAAARAHARHTPAQASCLDCHMPRITQGVTEAVRSHRISAPGDPRMLASAAPNACNVCHTEKSAAWTIAELNRGWGLAIEPDAAWAKAWGGSLENAAMDVWAKSPLQATKVALIDALSRRRDRRSLGPLIDQLADPAGTTRALAALGLERRLGRRLELSELDVTAELPERSRQIAALRSALAAQPER